MQMNHWIIRIGIALFIGTLACARLTTPGEKPPLLWHKSNFSGELPRLADTVHMVPVTVDINLLGAEDNTRFSLLLPGGQALTVVKIRQESMREYGFVWNGKIDKAPYSSVAFSVVKNTVLGNIITTNRKVYRLRNVKDNVYVIEEVDPGKSPPDIDTPPAPLGSSLNTRLVANGCTTDGADRIDVMILYTPNARMGAEVFGPDGIVHVAMQAVNVTNTSYVNSNIIQQLYPVHLAEVNYTETGDLTVDLNNFLLGNIKDVSAPPHTVKELRDSIYRADVVALILEYTAGDPGGYAYTMPSRDEAMAVVNRYYAFSYFSLAHELGHVMGADHNWEAPYTTTDKNAHGHIQPSPTTNTIITPNDPFDPWRTIMALDMALDNGCSGGCVRVQYWSNPTVLYKGDNTGCDQNCGHPSRPQNNALVLNTTAPIVANYNCHVDHGDQFPPSPPRNLRIQ